MNLDDYNLDELISHIHHEFHHVYEAINKVKNNRYRNYNHYNDFVNNSGDTNLNVIDDCVNNSKTDEILESIISEDRRRRLFLEFDKAIRRGKMKMHDIN